ncbi:hypothetical protein [Roseomonas sp. KE0001]|uniref:hypothetical protein n=1 Tax=Roseomonas sp. KE0001 TaxID=2479201 RepID=UPI0018DF880D|nr:hypothetical protein [Roseomonas sp. KE0001]MBI0432813.1 hypothetical protein [Roseomonas sp. KE0001]
MTAMIAPALLAPALPAASAANMGNSHDEVSPSKGGNVPGRHIFAPEGENPDAELLDLCRRYMALEETYNRDLAGELAAEERGDRATEDALFEARSISARVMRGLLFDIMARPARTAEGAKAKATVALTKVQRSRDGEPWGPEDAVMDSLACDILSPGFAPPTVSPFVALLAELDVATRHYVAALEPCFRLLNDAGTPERARADAATAEYEAALSRIAALPARDPLGLVLKAAVVLREMENLHPAGPEGEVATSLRADLARNFPQVHRVMGW